MTARSLIAFPSSSDVERARASIDSQSRVRTETMDKPKPRPFTPADKVLIEKLHGYMPIPKLLQVLNDRLDADMPGAPTYTIEQLHAAIAQLGAAAPPEEHGSDWASLRKLVARAQRDGILEKITRQVIDDFAVVFSLSPAQVLRLDDVLLQRKDDTDE